MFGRKARSITRQTVRRSFLRVESLESRNLLSGTPWQNPISCNDLDNDGAVAASDVLTAINAINAGGSGSLSNKMTAPTLSGGSSSFLDADGDGELTAADPLSVINAINARHPDAPPHEDLPDIDQQADAIDPSIPSLELDHGFTRVKAELNSAGDVDVFKVVAATTSLNVALFSRTAGISVAVQDASGVAVGSATNNPTTHHPAAVHVTPDVGATYYIVVSGGTDTTGEYCVQVIDRGNPPPPPPGRDGGTDTSDSDHPAPPPPTGDGGDNNSGDTTNGSQSQSHPPLPPPPTSSPPSPDDVFKHLDANPDGSLSATEFAKLRLPPGVTTALDKLFASWDTDSSGLLSLTEFDLGFASFKKS